MSQTCILKHYLFDIADLHGDQHFRFVEPFSVPRWGLRSRRDRTKEDQHMMQAFGLVLERDQQDVDERNANKA